jgi:hypothetical protein
VQGDDGQIRGARRRRRLRAAAAGVAATLAVGAAALTAGTASADTGVESAGAGSTATSTVGADIPNPGKDYRVKFAYWVREGTQTYACDTATGTWATKSTPEATLYAYGLLPPIHHFAGPSWQAKDRSLITATVIPEKTVPKIGTIPWLLLKVNNPTTGSRQMDGVEFVTRAHTRGGAGPTGPCSANQTKAVPYRADYIFWTKR